MKRVLFCLLLAAFSIQLAPAQTGSSLKKVTVYFWEFNREEPGDDLIAFTRYVDPKAPLRPTIEALLAGPTKAEDLGRYTSVDYDNLTLVSAKIRRGTARIDFSRVVGDNPNPGDLLTLRFEKAVIKTALQFPEIKKVIVCVNGMNEFGIGLVEDAPRLCPKKW